MRITAIDVRRVAIPLAEEVRWVGASESFNDLLMLRITTNEAVFGLAQKKVHIAWSGMSMADCAAELLHVYRPILVGRDPLDAEAIWTELDDISGWSPSKVLIDIALHDVGARASRLPMWRHLGGGSGDVAVLGFIARGDIDERLETMQAQIAQFGFRGFKIKIGGDESDDLAFLTAVRDRFGSDLLLRVDANWGYAPDRVLQISDRLAALGVEDFEDPCPLVDRSARRALFAQSALPLVIDNPITSRQAALEAIEDGAPRMALKVSRLGYRICRQIVADCDAAGVGVVAGSMTESAIGALGALHFHAGHRQFSFSPSEDGYFLTLPDDISARPIVRDGIVALGEGPGISPDWDEEKMRRYARPINKQ